jgi:hypothetical protein
MDDFAMTRQWREWGMSAETKKSTGWMVVLMVLGVAALYADSKWLAILIPAALLVWHEASPVLRSGRN